MKPANGAKAPDIKEEVTEEAKEEVKAKPQKPKIIEVKGTEQAEEKRLLGYQVVEVKTIDDVKTYFMEMKK